MQVLDKGFVQLVDHMGSDLTVVNSARVSFGKQKTELTTGDEILIRYLADNKHMSPFRHVQFQFHIKAPEFIMRQWYKHVVGIVWGDRTPDHAWNEISGRYVEYKPEFYVPRKWRKQSQDNKQATTNEEVNKEEADEWYIQALDMSWLAYTNLLKQGVGKEQARIVLPLSMYTEVIWTASLEAVGNFLKLRDHPHAQWEIREYALAVKELIRPIVPVSLGALGG